jgi:hypothetical protein
MYSTADLKKQFSNEQVLIILLSRLYLNTISKQEVNDFLESETIDYRLVYIIASVHNVRPVLFQVISSNNLKIDADVLMQLKNFSLQNHMRSMEQLTLCNSTLNDLQSKNISSIPFKGTLFSYLYYGNIGLRESTDIDLLVSYNDVVAIEDHFKSKHLDPKVAVPTQYLAYYKKYFKEIVYIGRTESNKNCSIEIHWKALNYYFGSYPEFSFFKDGETKVKIGPMNFPVLQPTYDFIAVASNHFIKDMAVKFKYIMDIACLIKKHNHSLDVDLIDRVVTDHHCKKKMEFGLFMIEKLLGINIPAFNNTYTFNKDSVSSALQVPVLVNDFNVTNGAFISRSIQLQDSLLQKIKFIGRCTFYFLLPTDNDLNSAARIKIPILILAALRPFRLGFKAVGQLFKAK